MLIGARPTDEQILAALGRAGYGSPTYVIKNWLADREFGRFDNLKTSHVLYRLKKLEKAGKVIRAPNWYFGHDYHWTLAPSV